jgi:peptidoglycan/xylan/chitin deacetylase (PgdA/CDA1 family)
LLISYFYVFPIYLRLEYNNQIIQFKKMAELLIIASIILLSWKFDVHPLIPIGIISIMYWLPKCIIVNTLEYFNPNILTRNKPKYNQEIKRVALTFDDVPYGSSFDEIVKVFDDHKMKASFFVISDYITNENEAKLIECINSGHQLCNHGKTNSMHALKSEFNLTNEIMICDAKIKELYDKSNNKFNKIDDNNDTGKYKQHTYTKIYRPGCGLFTSKMLTVLDKLNYKLALGSVYPNDPFIISSTINYYYLINHLEDGDIVILHDRKWTAPMLKWLLKWISENNFESVTLNELLK